MAWSDYLRFAAALLFVLSLIGLSSWALRRFGFGVQVTPNRGNRRVAIVEVTPVDGKRRLILVRRDDREHLLLLGLNQDLLIESVNCTPVGNDSANALQLQTPDGS